MPSTNEKGVNKILLWWPFTYVRFSIFLIKTYTLHPPTLWLSHSRSCPLDILRSHMFNNLCKCSFNTAHWTRPLTCNAVHQKQSAAKCQSRPNALTYHFFLRPRKQQTLVWLHRFLFYFLLTVQLKKIMLMY